MTYHGAHLVVDDVAFLPTPDGATVRQISAFLRDCRADAGLDGRP